MKLLLSLIRSDAHSSFSKLLPTALLVVLKPFLRNVKFKRAESRVISL